MKKRFLFLSIFFVIISLLKVNPLLAGVLDLDQEAPVLLKTASWLLTFSTEAIKTQWIAYTTWFVTIMIAIQATARGLAELLSLFADKTATDIDNKAMMALSNVAKICGKIVGWFGIGYPKGLK